MDHLLEIFIALFSIIFLVGVVFKKISIPTPLLLVMAGMLISFLPALPRIRLNPELVLDVFLPLLIYEISAQSSWRDMKSNINSIMFLSIGHVLFITLCVAVVIHTLIPEIGWPLAFVLGAVVSPPDDVAVVSIAKEITIPKRITTILKGEGMLNDATALIVFRFSLAAAITHQFTITGTVSTYILVLLCETAYGIALGNLIGAIRVRVQDSKLQMIISALTPFLAYLPAARLGGSGVLATVVTGLVIGHLYIERFAPEVRLVVYSIWQTLGFAIQSLLFLLVGLNLRFILEGISAIPYGDLALYTVCTVLTITIGRFIWVFGAYVPQYLFRSKKLSYNQPWQYSFIISWAGMRGGISLAAAVAIPFLPTTIHGVNVKELILFIVFCVIITTLLFQGITLPWLLRKLGVSRYSEKEKHTEYVEELKARYKMASAVYRWLRHYKLLIKDQPELLEEVSLQMGMVKMIRKKFRETLKNHDQFEEMHNNEEEILKESILISKKILEVERHTVDELWRAEKISHAVRTKLILQLDHRARNLG